MMLYEASRRGFGKLAMISVLIAASACYGTKNKEENCKMIVCFFSATGTTEQQATALKLVEIPYHSNGNFIANQAHLTEILKSPNMGLNF